MAETSGSKPGYLGTQLALGQQGHWDSGHPTCNGHNLHIKLPEGMYEAEREREAQQFPLMGTDMLPSSPPFPHSIRI